MVCVTDGEVSDIFFFVFCTSQN